MYICATLFGFAISWKFVSGVSRSAEYMEVIGWRASTFSAGCFIIFRIFDWGLFFMKISCKK